jgi:hypothetical protein
MTTVERNTESFALDGAGGGLRAAALVVGVLGLAVAAGLGLSGGEESRLHFFHAYLTAFAYWLSIALGALFFVLMAHLTRAGWSVSLRRVVEVVASNVWIFAVLGVVVLWGLRDLYPWAAQFAAGDLDELNRHKSPYLNPTFFAIRIGFYFVCWIGLSAHFLSRSRRQDDSGDPALTRGLEKLSAPGTILFALTLTFAAFDLLMSLYPHWFSTIFGVYYFAGCVVGSVSFVILLLMYLQSRGRLTRVVNREHFHDLGKLQFAFVVFWAYIAFSQYMLIWYGNLPEETIWYKYRQTGQWSAVSILLLIGHFVVPFLAMLSRHPKRRRTTLAVASVWLLVMHWVDMYWLVFPHVHEYKGVVPFGIQEIAGFVGVGGLFVAAVLWRLGRQALVPVRDPRIQEALQFENA